MIKTSTSNHSRYYKINIQESISSSGINEENFYNQIKPHLNRMIKRPSRQSVLKILEYAHLKK